MSMDYQVVVIGAGIIGASIAAKLAHLGLSVALIERGTAGASGASSHSGGLLRLYDDDPLLMALAARSIDLLNDEPFASAYTPALQRTGMLYRAAPQALDSMQDAIARYGSERYPLRLLDRQQLAALYPSLPADEENIVLFEPHAWVGNVRQAAAALAGQVRSNGLLLEHAEVTAIDWLSRHEARVNVGATSVTCRAVVIATGAWSGQWLPSGLEVRSIPLARVRSAEPWPLPVIDAVSQSYGIPLAARLVQTGCQPRALASCPTRLPTPNEHHAADGLARIGCLSGAGEHQVIDVLPGFDGYSPDGRPLVGFLDQASPLYIATGLSGVGFKLAPAIAELAAGQLRCHLSGEAPGVEWPGLSPARSKETPDRQGGRP